MTDSTDSADKKASTGLAEKLREGLRYVTGSGAVLFINLGVTAFSHEVVGLSEATAYAIALGVAFLTSFFLMRHYVRRAQHGAIGRQILGFALSAIAFRVAEYFAFVFVLETLKVHYLLAVCLVNGLSFLIKFFYYQVFVFGDARIPDKQS